MAKEGKGKIEKLNGMNFQWWKMQVEDCLYQKDLYLQLVGEKPEAMNANEWAILYKKALATRLFNMRMSKNGFVVDHLNDFNGVTNQPEFVSINFDVEIRALLFLYSLPDSWNNLVTTVSNSTISGMLMLSDVVSSVMNDEMRRKMIGDDISSSIALFVEFKGRQNNKQKNMERTLTRGRSKSRGNSKSKGRTIVCRNCNKEGHKKNDCTEPKKKNGAGGRRGDDDGANMMMLLERPGYMSLDKNLMFITLLRSGKLLLRTKHGTRTGYSRGFAFVRYKYADEVQKAVDSGWCSSTGYEAAPLYGPSPLYHALTKKRVADAPNESTNIDDAKYRGGGGGYGGGGWGGGGGRKCCGKDAKGANAVESQMKTDKPATTTESIEVDDAKYQGGGGGYGGGGGGYGGGGHGGGWGGGGGRKCCGKNAKESQMKNDKPDVAEP
ncbi:hypothetical protein RJ640_013632 [Escallonia rubra]|uniref:CCHC-type domain-containing protein n=1 Tax=Escallonia rubra TaxID=112253 RepID=A0AA88QTZ1_9ASTE|nr:hypothetical protein RJ640_013632 [Escallonia rubra]